MTQPNAAPDYFHAYVLDGTDECMIWPFGATGAGYGQVYIRRRKFYVHVLACIAHHGPRPEGMEAAHGPCHNPRCWNGRHLSWESPATNQADRKRDGTHRAGEAVNLTKLTADQVREIRRLWATGEWNKTALGRAFGVTRGNVRAIVNRRSWAHI